MYCLHCLTVLQSFNERLFIPKTFFIFFLANLHIAILCYKTGGIESVLISMIPTALVLIVYLVVVFLSKQIREYRSLGKFRLPVWPALRGIAHAD